MTQDLNAGEPGNELTRRNALSGIFRAVCAIPAATGALAAAPIPVPVNPALVDLGNRLDEAFQALDRCIEATKPAEEAFGRWAAANPEPQMPPWLRGETTEQLRGTLDAFQARRADWLRAKAAAMADTRFDVTQLAENRADEAVEQISQEMADTPATSLRDLVFKAQIAHQFGEGLIERSIVRDLLALGGQRHG